MPFVEGCGHCEYCRSGNAQVCPDQTQPGFTGPGSFAERVAIHGADVNLVRLPASVDFRVAAALGCRFATAFRAVTMHGRLSGGQWIAVFGLGGLGLSAVMIAVSLGARVVAIDNHLPALARAARLGAEHTLSVGLDADQFVCEITGGGAHVTVDAVGSAQIAATAVRSLRRRGRHIQVGLLLGDDAMTALPMDRVVAYELEIFGSHGMAAADYAAMLSRVESGVLRPEKLIGSVVGLHDAGPALAAMDTYGADGMTIIDIPDE
jgi:alcohol dehydrogenase